MKDSPPHSRQRNCTGLKVMNLGRRGSSRPDLGTEGKQTGREGTAASKGPGRGQGRASTSDQRKGRMTTLYASHPS